MCPKNVKLPSDAPCSHKNADDEYIPTRKIYATEETIIGIQGISGVSCLLKRSPRAPRTSI
uniref:Uncharacterized protein n=1 Tax=Arundo donax TaxID=35708 RepID=A0A0A9F097_ARUDO